MDVEERNQWIDRSVKYLRLVADHVDSIVITTKDGDTITFKSNTPNTVEVTNEE